MKRTLLLLISVALVACAVPAPVPQNPGGITFVHLNDTYRVGPVDSGKGGGFGRVVTLVRALQAEGRDVRILHGGDFLYPSLESQLWDGLQMVDAFNYMNDIAPLYAVAGNHEFDRRTAKQLIAAVKASDFVWLGDNNYFRRPVTRQLTPRYKRDSPLRRVVGRSVWFALTLHSDDGGNDSRLCLVSTRTIKTVRPGKARSILNLEAKGVDAIVGVTHLHLWTGPRDRAPQGGTSQIDVRRRRARTRAAVCSPASSADVAAVVKGASNARVIWMIDLDFDDQGQPVINEKKLRTRRRASRWTPTISRWTTSGVSD